MTSRKEDPFWTVMIFVFIILPHIVVWIVGYGRHSVLADNATKRSFRGLG